MIFDFDEFNNLYEYIGDAHNEFANFLHYRIIETGAVEISIDRIAFAILVSAGTSDNVHHIFEGDGTNEITAGTIEEGNFDGYTAWVDWDSNTRGFVKLMSLDEEILETIELVNYQGLV